MSETLFLFRLIPPRADFAQTMTSEEQHAMAGHMEYWQRLLHDGQVVVYGPVADPEGVWGLGVLRAADGSANPSVNEIYASGLNKPFGIAFYPGGDDPQWIYVGNTDSLVRIPYKNGDLKATGAVETRNSATRSTALVVVVLPPCNPPL